MKKIKWLILGVVGLVVVVVGGLLLYIDQAAKAGVEAGGTYALGVDTKLDGMDIGILAGSVQMDELNVTNPPGFETPHFLHLGQGRVAVSLGTLMEDKVVLPELTLSNLSLNLENKQGKSNYQAILDNLKKFESKDGGKAEKPKEEPSPQEKEGGKTFVIERVTIQDVNVQVDLLPVGGKLTRTPVKIEKIELKDVGTGSDKGLKMEELTALLMKAILKAVAEKGSGLLPGNIAGELTAGLNGLKDLGGASVAVVGEVTSAVSGEVAKVGESAKAAADQATKQITEGAAKDVTKGAEEATKKVGDTLKDAGKGLGGLLGDKKKAK
jgi:hypothetical protein